MFRVKQAVLLWTLYAISAVAFSSELIVSPTVRLTTQDVTAAVQAQLRDDERVQMLGDKGQFRRVIDGLYLSFAAAADARRNGLDSTPRIKAKLDKAAVDILAQAQIEYLIDKELKDKDFTPAAAEYYLANKEQFKLPETIAASHILIKVSNERSKEDALARITDIRKKVMDDPDLFEELARTHSDDAGSGAKGGALGTFSRKKMVKPFSEAAFALQKKGALSDIVESRFGFHLIRLDRPHVDGYREYEEVKEQIIKRIKGDIKRLVREEYLISLRDAPDVIVNEANMKKYLDNPDAVDTTE